MKIVVTGGQGDLGRNLVPYLLEQGHVVVSIDRMMPPPTPPAPGPRPWFMAADVRDFGQVVGAVRECDGVIHLAAHRSAGSTPDTVVYADNTVASYNVLSAASALGIKRVCLASSINAIGGVYSRSPRYDYFPVDEQHTTYAEDPYSLSKWVLEQQGDSFARRYEWMSIASLRFHWLLASREVAVQYSSGDSTYAIKHLWAYTLMAEACRACLLSLTADISGHEAFYIVAPRTAVPEASLDLARQHYPNTEVRGALAGQAGFFNCDKAARLLGWRHAE